jgi:hypothetical protein
MIRYFDAELETVGLDGDVDSLSERDESESLFFSPK